MNCQRAQLLLLQSDDPRPSRCGSPTLAAHLRHCVACRRLAGKVAQIEEAWRLEPVPAEAEAARVAFLRKLPQQPAAAHRLAPSWPRVSVRWAAAAVLLLAVGMGALLLLPSGKVEAAPDLVERLVEWNLEIAQAPTPEERERIHAQRAENLTRALADVRLTAEDRQAAEKLLAAGSRLARENDPLIEADHLHDMNDLLVERLQLAADQGNDAQVNRLAKQVQRVGEKGLAPRLHKIAAADPAPPDRQQRLERLNEREARRVAHLEKVMEKASKEAKKEIKKALDGAHKQQKMLRKGK